MSSGGCRTYVRIVLLQTVHSFQPLDSNLTLAVYLTNCFVVAVVTRRRKPFFNFPASLHVCIRSGGAPKILERRQNSSFLFLPFSLSSMKKHSFPFPTSPFLRFFRDFCRNFAAKRGMNSHIRHLPLRNRGSKSEFDLPSSTPVFAEIQRRSGALFRLAVPLPRLIFSFYSLEIETLRLPNSSNVVKKYFFIFPFSSLAS